MKLVQDIIPNTAEEKLMQYSAVWSDDEELMFDIERLKDMQSERVVALDENIDIKLRFSMGYCLAGEEIRYQELLMEADRKMYENKAQRKKLAGRK